MTTENKGYKFRLEHTERFDKTEEDEADAPDSTSTTFVTYGDSENDAIDSHKALYEAWDKFLDKEQRRFGDKRKFR